MASLGRIVGLVLVGVCLAVLVTRHPPGWLRAHVDAVRASGDPWTAYLASERDCPGGHRTDLAAVEQDRAMVCLLSYARARAGVRSLPVVYLLNRASLLKAMDIVRCSDFSHTACGHPFPSVFEAVGYAGRTGENIAWGAGSAGSPATVVSGWLNSPHHRENLFSREWVEQGVALVPAASFLGERQAEVWVNEFGNPA